ncbi:MAG: transcription-repair coupling factor [Syntrophomonadaceae bacterium]|nr:transcription-repair coupling factor [Syntrophomonadaceae bacterium]
MNLELMDAIQHNLNSGHDIMLSGLSGSARTYLLQAIFQDAPGKLLYIAPGEEQAYDIAQELTDLLGADKIALFLERDFVFMKENTSRTEVDRIATLQNLLAHPRRKMLIITTTGGLLYHVISPAIMQKATLLLELGRDYALPELLRQLVMAGYERADTVTRPGQIAVRGGILDVFPVGDREPCRAEFFGDTLDMLRRFDLNTQRSAKKESRLTIPPADELRGENLHSTLLDYFPENSRVFFDEPRIFYQTLDRQSRRYREFLKEARKEDANRPELALLHRDAWIEALNRHTIIYHSFFAGNIPQVSVAWYEHIAQIEMEPFYKRYDSLFVRLQEWLAQDYTVIFAVKSENLQDEIKQELSDRHLVGVEFITRNYQRGFISQTLKLALITERDIWGKKTSRVNRSRAPGEQRVLVEDLQRGDYIVHEQYGIGIYRGVTQVETDGVIREYILLQYAGTDKLYLPVDKLDLLHRYSSSEEKEPRLSKLGGSEWERTRQRVAQSIQEMAQELLLLYATRASLEGHAFAPDTPWQAQFEEEFPYQETPDQLKAIRDVKRDMESRKPMDRLVCGDVGYGKTEVALRAAFKAVMDGKQVAILVPTTVLAEQHFETFTKRFQNFPANLEVLSRFKSPAAQKKIVADLASGVVDVVIATHRLLSKDVKFHNLGLLVVDEEHRFGVVQKEKVKALKQQVDVLSLSATPIPRSLHMGLTGLRDLSVIETPPPERYPITTYVMEYNEKIVREAILTEVARGGQVFFVHNRIQDIYGRKEALQKILPEIKIAVGHGKMKEDELARAIMKFIQGEYDVFLCTTIIESGLDMPNVNTIIIDMADRMGLAQLYQLRGRVGRSNRVAYAYLTYYPDKVITEASQKRLNAIREFNELGAGIRIALRDLEIRGAGNILGAEQHGYIHAVGFDMYCRLLGQETSKLKGKVMQEPFQPQLDIDMDYYIPDSYIPDSGTKMRIYRRLLLAADYTDIEGIKNEIEDRFGKLPQPVENFLQVASLRLKARDKQIKGLRRKGQEVEIQLVRPLPDAYTPPAGLKIKKLNPYTLKINLHGANSLQDLQNVLDLVQ